MASAESMMGCPDLHPYSHPCSSPHSCWRWHHEPREASALPPSLLGMGAPTCTQPCQWKEQWGALPPTSQEGIREGGKPGFPTPAHQEGGALPRHWGVSRSPQGNLGFHTNRRNKERHPPLPVWRSERRPTEAEISINPTASKCTADTELPFNKLTEFWSSVSQQCKYINTTELHLRIVKRVNFCFLPQF